MAHIVDTKSTNKHPSTSSRHSSTK